MFMVYCMMFFLLLRWDLGYRDSFNGMRRFKSWLKGSCKVNSEIADKIAIFQGNILCFHWTNFKIAINKMYANAL